MNWNNLKMKFKLIYKKNKHRLVLDLDDDFDIEYFTADIIRILKVNPDDYIADFPIIRQIFHGAYYYELFYIDYNEVYKLIDILNSKLLLNEIDNPTNKSSLHNIYNFFLIRG